MKYKVGGITPADHQVTTPSQKESLSAPEPEPIKNDLPAVWDLVIKDIEERDESGLKKYGTRLQPFNGRDALVDAYQEALDLVVYLRQAIYEREADSLKSESALKPQLNTLNEEFEKWLDTIFDISPANPQPGIINKEYCKCMMHEGAGQPYQMVNDPDWYCPKCERQVDPESKDIDRLIYCTCKGAVHMYEGSDGHFRCRSCVKRIPKNN